LQRKSDTGEASAEKTLYILDRSGREEIYARLARTIPTRVSRDTCVRCIGKVSYV